MTKEEINKIKNAESKAELLPLLHVWWDGLDDNWRRAFVEETPLRELLNTLVCKHYTVWDPKPKNGWPELSMEQLEKHIHKLFVYVEEHYEDKFLKQIIQFFTLPLSIKISGYYEESEEDYGVFPEFIYYKNSNETLEPLRNFENLKTLDCSISMVSSLEPLKELENIELIVTIRSALTDEQLSDFLKTARSRPSINSAYGVYFSDKEKEVNPDEAAEQSKYWSPISRHLKSIFEEEKIGEPLKARQECSICKYIPPSISNSWVEGESPEDVYPEACSELRTLIMYGHSNNRVNCCPECNRLYLYEYSFEHYPSSPGDNFESFYECSVYEACTYLHTHLTGFSFYGVVKNGDLYDVK